MHSAIVTAPKDDVPPGGKTWTWINKKHFGLISMGNTENVLNLKIYKQNESMGTLADNTHKYL